MAVVDHKTLVVPSIACGAPETNGALTVLGIQHALELLHADAVGPLKPSNELAFFNAGAGAVRDPPFLLALIILCPAVPRVAGVATLLCGESIESLQAIRALHINSVLYSLQLSQLS